MVVSAARSGLAVFHQLTTSLSLSCHIIGIPLAKTISLVLAMMSDKAPTGSVVTQTFVMVECRGMVEAQSLVLAQFVDAHGLSGVKPEGQHSQAVVPFGANAFCE